MNQEVVVVIGAGGIGMAIARRQGFGRQILLADFNEELLASAAKDLEAASYKVATLKVDVSSRASVRALAVRLAKARRGSSRSACRCNLAVKVLDPPDGVRFCQSPHRSPSMVATVFRSTNSPA